jgi:hypothetical protein
MPVAPIVCPDLSCLSFSRRWSAITWDLVDKFDNQRLPDSRLIKTLPPGAFLKQGIRNGILNARLSIQLWISSDVELVGPPFMRIN